MFPNRLRVARGTRFASSEFSFTRMLLAGAALSVLTVQHAHAQDRDQAQAKANDTIGAAPSADDAGTAPGSSFEEITVTARRVEESAQRVPLAITALSGSDLKKQSITEVSQFTKTIPGVSLCCSAFFNSGNIFVRGMATGAPTYFADVPVQAGGYGNFFDVASAEVLKGPQGTLFGQASNAGAFVFRPVRPTDKFEGYLSLVGGSYDRRNVEGALNIPLFEDRVLLRLSAISASRRGYVHDLSNDQNYGNEDYWIVRPSLTLKISDNLENYTMYQHSSAKTNGFSDSVFVLDDFNFNANQVSQNGLLVALNGGTQAAYEALRVQALLEQRARGPYVVNGLSVGCQGIAPQSLGPNQVTSLRYSNQFCGNDSFVEDRVVNQTTLRIGENWTIKNIFGYSYSRQRQGEADYDGSPLILVQVRNPYQVDPVPGPKQYSNEFQVLGTVGPVDVTAGAFYVKAKTDTGIVLGGFDIFPNASRTLSSRESKAIYGQANIHLDSLVEGLSASVGLRYTKDRNSQSGYNYDYATLQQAGDPLVLPNQSYHNVSYTLGLQYQVTPQTMLFVTNSRGYNAGGYNNAAGLETYLPSELNNVEAGIKSTFDVGGMHFRVNASGYYGWLSDAQVFAYVLVTNPITHEQTTVGTTRNAASALIRGLEGEFSVIPFSGFELSGNVAYQANKYTKYSSIDPVTQKPLDLSDTKFLFSPKWKVSLHASYRLPLSSSIGSISLLGDMSFRTKMVNSTVPLRPTDPTNPMTGLVCTRQATVANGYPQALADGRTMYVDCNQGFTNVDLGVQWSQVMGNEHLGLALQVTNVTKNVLSDSRANLRDFGYVAPAPALPRMWTIRGTYTF